MELGEVTTVDWGGASRRAFAITHAGDLPHERPPERGTLEALIANAKENGLPEFYRQFLDGIRDEPQDDNFRSGLLVVGHRESSGPPGIGVARLSRADAAKRELRSFAAVVYRERACLVRVEELPEAEEGHCQLNQTVRHVLGIPGRLCYGATVELFPVRRRQRPFPFVEPRPLCLPLFRPSYLDAENNSCVLDSRNIALLGIEAGQYVRLRVVRPDSENRYEVHNCSLRVFPGSSSEVWRGPDRITYPREHEIYVDAYGRRELGIHRHSEGMPVTVTADVGQLFLGRLVFYAGTLLLSLVALAPLRSVVGIVPSISLGLVVTVLVTLFDLRSRVQY